MNDERPLSASTPEDLSSREVIDDLRAELADLRQQLAEARIESLNCKAAHGTDLENIAAQLREASQQLAEARAENERLTLQKEIIKRWHTRNEEEADAQLAAQAAELATLRERLAECDTYHAPRIAELERLNKEQFDRFSDLLSVLGNINQCRTAEGDSIEILCDNPEAWSVDKQAAVEVSGAYTDYEPTKFFGSTWQEALQKAADCARRYYSG